MATPRRAFGPRPGRPGGGARTAGPSSTCWHLSASFQAPEEGFEHADAKPEVPGPAGLSSQAELARRHAARIPEPLRARATADGPIEIRPVDPMDPMKAMNPDVRPPESAAWFRAAGGCRWPPSTTRSGTTARLPTAGRADRWLLHVVESPSASGGRGLVRGRMFTEEGVLVASTMQEGLIRQRR